MRRNRTALAVPAAVAALLLTACGGSDGGGEGEELIGAEQSGDGGGGEERPEPEASPSEAEETDDGVPRPEIELPDGFENVWEDWESDNPEEQAVLRDVREAQNAVDLAILERDPEAGYVSFYHSAEALVSTEDWISGFISNERTIAGTVRYHHPKVTFSGEDGATVTYCADESRASAVDVESGEALEGDTGQHEVAYSNLLAKDKRGVWMTTVVNADRQECSS